MKKFSSMLILVVFMFSFMVIHVRAGDIEGSGDVQGTFDYCQELISKNNENIVDDIYTMFLIAAPILVIMMGALDYGKAVLASDADAMKKATKRFTTRIIAMLILFLLPVIINFIMYQVAGSGIFPEGIPTTCLD